MKNIHWIQGDTVCESPLFRHSFTAGKLAKAVIEICGLGYFSLYVNGRKVSEDLLTPACSTYSSVLGCQTYYPVWEERAGFRTYYLEYDLLPYLWEGENVIGVHLGNGWYHQNRRVAEGEFIFGRPMLRYELALIDTDGKETRIESDSGTLWKESEITENNLFYGETHDLRQYDPHWAEPGASGSGWKKALPVHAPETNLVKQDFPPDRVIRQLSPALVYEDGGRKIYDSGENIAGWVQLRVTGAPGETVVIRHSENLSGDGTRLNFATAGGEGQIQADTYICGGGPLSVHPKFTWHGFRYFEVTGPGFPETVAVVHSGLAVTSSFKCSSPVLNWLYEAYVRTQLNNIHGCIPSDCPHRERLGYTGDGQLTAKSALLTLDAGKMYQKWMEDILDSQGVETGHIPHTAPFFGGGGGPGGWGGAVFIVPMAYYEILGDKSLLERSYPAILRWLDYMDSRSEKGLIVREEEGGWCLGDWCSPDEKRPAIPEPLVNTYYYIKGLRAALQAAKLLGEPEPAGITQRLAASEKAFVDAYYDPETGSFAGGANAADAFAMDLDLETAQTRRNLVEKYSKTRCLDTGIFGTDVLLDVLFQIGETDLAFELMNGKTSASYARMMEEGATTIWETWDGKASNNHPMFGGPVRLLFTEILGIRQRPGTAGFSDYKVRPAAIKGLSWAKGHITTPRGKIFVDWERDDAGDIQVSTWVEPSS